MIEVVKTTKKERGKQMSGSMIVEKVTEVRQGKNQVVGVFVGKLHKGKIIAGWSRIKDDSNDEFEMKKGMKFAISNGIENKGIPFKKSLNDFADKYRTFRNRCLRYFQGFDFNGRTSELYSLRALAQRDGISQVKVADPLNSPLANFVRTQLQGMGVDLKSIEAFVAASVPIAEQLSAKGVTGIALPLNMDSMDFLTQMMGGMGLGKPVSVPY
jgi:hypothetical protein